MHRGELRSDGRLPTMISLLTVRPSPSERSDRLEIWRYDGHTVEMLFV